MLLVGVLVNELQQLVMVFETDYGERTANKVTLDPLSPPGVWISVEANRDRFALVDWVGLELMEADIQQQWESAVGLFFLRVTNPLAEKGSYSACSPQVVASLIHGRRCPKG